MRQRLYRRVGSAGFTGALWVVLLNFALPAAASDSIWLEADTAGIIRALEGRTVLYANARQDFYAGGFTEYGAGGGRPSPGSWRAENNRYCSVWPPAETWVCYRLLISMDGQRVRFISPDGGIDDGRYADE